jgi:Transglycosylase SLT domain/SPOR domain
MPLTRVWLSIVLLSAVAGVSHADDAIATDGQSEDATPEKTVCELIDEAAAAHALPIVFFTRLIWKESSFRAGAVSPKGAQGIAQFMPATAARRRLADPFDPAKAIPASAHYLKDLAIKFGNLGLAAAAYNAGEQRVADWIAGTRRLPAETLDYVLFVTGRHAADWADPDIADDAPEEEADAVDCTAVAAILSKPGAGSARVAIRQGGYAEWAPWGVQVAGNFSESRALASYKALQRRHEAILGGRDPLVLRSVVRSRGVAPMHQVRVPFQTREEADRLCGQLRKAGGACVVQRNAR